MTKTQQPQTTDEPKANRGLAWAAAGLVAVLAAAGLYFAFVYEPDTVAESTPPTTAPEPIPTTAAADETIAADLATIEAAVAAFYSGDAERAAELFELGDRTDDEIREESAYQAAIGGRLDLNCSGGTGGVFTCLTPYRNAMTDAIGASGGHDTWQVVVEDGVVTKFGFTEHSFVVIPFGIFLATDGRFEGYEDCSFGPFPESCATIQLENLDGWVQWRENIDRAKVVEVGLESWYGGDCEAALFIAAGDTECSTSSAPTQTIEYESILGAQVSVENCEATSTDNLSCEVHYSNAMNSTVGQPPSVTVREFTVDDEFPFVADAGQDRPWYEGVYPEDSELRESFRLFAEGGELRDEYADATCASARTPECANLILANLDAWGAWYETNG